MLFNWFTVVAQIINFLILVWLLKRYLYQPILNAIREREERIATQLKHAEGKEADALKERQLYLSKNEELDRNRTQLMQKANDEAAAERSRLLETARKEAGALRLKLETAFREEQSGLAADLSRRIRVEVMQVAQSILKELADSSLEDQIIHVFLARLGQSQEAKSFNWTSGAERSPSPVVIKSSLPLTPEQQELLKVSVRSTLQLKEDITFTIAPDLIAGIELSANGYKLTWSVADHLSSIEKTVDQLVKARTEKKPVDNNQVA
ncbi:MAG: F0F1 ATP synthase subunit B [Bacteroidetes bacterium]|nr:F0F1 ATP synthase subunit B [Bacteroidota bacterium]